MLFAEAIVPPSLHGLALDRYELRDRYAWALLSFAVELCEDFVRMSYEHVKIDSTHRPTTQTSMRRILLFALTSTYFFPPRHLSAMSTTTELQQRFAPLRYTFHPFHIRYSAILNLLHVR
jgi:hypothetical protein